MNSLTTSAFNLPGRIAAKAVAADLVGVRAHPVPGQLAQPPRRHRLSAPSPASSKAVISAT